MKTIICFITRRQRKDTPEEKVRQETAKYLIEELGYDKSQIEIEHRDEGLPGNRKYYYRIDVKSRGGAQLISNPIFFKKISR